MSPKTFNKFGFSLFEILIALGILAGAVASLMPLISVSASLSLQDDQLLNAVSLANNKMVEIEKDVNEDISRGKFPDEDSQSGFFDPPFSDYAWSYSLKKVEIPMVDGGAPGGGEGEEEGGSSVAYANIMRLVSQEMSKAVREVKVTVTWGDEDQKDENNYTLTTHLVNVK